MKENEKRLNLFSELKLIESAGIGFDKERLKKDISAQFQNTYAWAREYCANAYDAMASTCEFYGVEDEDTISIFVEDNGMGMSLDTLISFFTLYKSTKHGKRENPVGKFGIGKVSVAAIPGQIQFLVRTSDGKSCYEAHAGSLLSDEKIKIYSVPGTFKTGTKFQITFKKTEKVETTLNNITGVLIKYCKYLPLNVLVYPVQKKGASGKKGKPTLISQKWQEDSFPFGVSYTANISGNDFSLILAISKDMSHDLYQNRVFITDRFNLLNPESKDKKRIPYLKILVDSGSFELPFGRHDLQNEKILSPLSEYIRRVILPDYFEKVADKTWINGEIIRDFELAQFEKMSLAIMQLWPDLKKPWCHIPVFNVYNQEKKSLYDLEKLVVKTGKIYLAPKDDSGLDFSLFDGPVLLSDQVENGVDFLQKIFAKNITDLSDAGDIIEAPSHHCPEITGKEKNLEKHLGFHHELFESLNMKHGKIGVYKKATNEQTNFSDAKEVGLHLDNLTWRVNYLLNLNLTPCLIKRFIIKGTTLILNLYHPDVKKLVQISTIDCKLAGHWAVAMCLTEEHSAFPQFSAEAKEDLLILDAIIKISTSNNFLELMLSKEFLKVKKTCMNILKNFEKKYNMN